MALTAGTKLGPYEILGAAGAGGMGEVYRARDTRLERTVAIKVLPEQFSQNPDLKQRFEREARAISSLNHPNICTLYDVGHQDGVDYLVMEYIEGESLAARLMRGPLPVEQTLKTGSEIAEALEKAHRQGIVHRDLKPGNVMLTKSGAKLLDFGLAKPAGGAMQPGSVLTQAITQTSPASPITQAGMLVGTFQYMAPEQVEGKDADARSDIFALGAVLYEMATGKRAFEGKSAISVASAILEKEPEPISKAQPLTPPVLEQVVRGCLAKDPEERFQTAHDVKLQLKWIAEGGSSAVGLAPPIAARRKHREWTAWAAAAVLLVAAVVLGALYWRSASRPERRISAQLLPPAKTRFLFTGDTGGPATVSPDGAWMAFVAVGADGQARLWVQSLDGVTQQVLPGTEDATFPFWSADSRSLAFFADGKLKRVDVAGGPPQTLCDAPGGRGGSWGKEGVIVFTPDTQEGLWQVSASGGTPTPILKTDQKTYTTYRWPWFLPDGKHFLYLAANHNAFQGEKTGVYFASLDGKENKLVVHTFAGAEYAQGYLLFLRENTLLAQPFDASRGELKGEAAPVGAEVQFDLSTWHGIFAVSEAGLLAYQAGGSGTGSRLTWYDRSGKKLGTVGERQSYYSVMLSPDGRKLAVAAGDPSTDLWIYDLERGVKTRLTFGTGVLNNSPVWSPDGSRIAFASNRSNRTFNLYEKPADGTGAEEELLPAGNERGPSSWSPDGKALAFVQTAPGKGASIWMLPLNGERKPFPFLEGPAANYASAVFSPDGRWLAYMSIESGQWEVYVTRFPGPAGKWQISSGGGQTPVWRRDGKELYFMSPSRDLMAVAANGSGASFEAGTPQRLFTTSGISNPTFAYDVSRDGQRFLINSLDEDASQPISLLLNWRAGMKK